MTFVVPFDGSVLAAVALDRAVAAGKVLDKPVLAVSVVRKADTAYARKKGWLDADEPFDLDTIVTRLREHVEDISPSVVFRYSVVGRYAPHSEVGHELRKLAREADATVVFVGSDNAGRIVSSLSSVGTNVATDTAYDVHIVRSPKSKRNPLISEAVSDASPERPGSE